MMAKKRKAGRARGVPFGLASKLRKASKSRNRSVLTAEELYLNRHDEDKVLLFTAGILFGTGTAVSILTNALWYSGIALLVLALVMLLVEKRQEGL